MIFLISERAPHPDLSGRTRCKTSLGRSSEGMLHADVFFGIGILCLKAWLRIKPGCSSKWPRTHLL
jgi:hypothetical protein